MKINYLIECWKCAHAWWEPVETEAAGEVTVICPKCGEVNPT